MTRNRNVAFIIIEIMMILFIMVFISPLLIILLNSFKSYKEILTNILSLPSVLLFENYVSAWNDMNYPRAFLNTLILTVGGVVGLIFIGSAAAYKLSRVKSTLSKGIFILCIIPMLIPFQTIMISLTQVAKELYLINSIPGTIILYWGLGMPFVVFMYHGFIKSIPRELEESASIDGCSTFRAFFQIVFPQLKPVTTTLIVLNVMWIWNDFLFPLIVINRDASKRTLPLSTFSFFGRYDNEWSYALAALVMTVMPAILFFIVMQKYIIKGVMGGSIKG